MKGILLVGLLVLAAIGVVIWQEGRVTALKREVAELREGRGGDAPSRGSRQMAGTGAGSPGSVASKGASRTEDDESAAAESAEEDGFGEVMRQILENPAGRAMINEENKGKAARIYAALLEKFDLSKEEEAYFIDLLAAGLGEEDAAGMRMISAKTDAEREQILDEMEAAREERRKQIGEFLNSEEDLAEYETYQARKAEYEQLPSIKAVMDNIGASLSGDQEAALVEAMFEARSESGMIERWEGRAGFEQFGEPGVVARYEEDWDTMQGTLEQRVDGLLNEDQQAALGEHQEQVKQFVVMSLRWVEGMVQGQAAGGE